MTYKFIEYIKNETPPQQTHGLLGIASVTDGNKIYNFLVREGKEGKGYYITEMAQKLNDQWYKSFVTDSRIEENEIHSLIRKHLSGEQSQSKSDDEMPQFSEECPF